MVPGHPLPRHRRAPSSRQAGISPRPTTLPQPGCPTCDPLTLNVSYELLPEDRCDHHEEGEFDWLHNALQGAWISVDYTHFTIKTPGNTLLGATPAGILHPRDYFLVDDGMGNTLGQARVLDTHKVDFDNIDGVKIGFGMPLMFGAFEANVWAFEQTEDFVNTDDIPSGVGPPDATYVATPLLTNGAPGATLILSDLAFEARHRANAFGTEANLYFRNHYNDYGLYLQGMLGGRYLNYSEELTQTGLFNDNGALAVPLRSFIGSDVTNNFVGPQAGIRAEFVNQHFTLGIEPKLMLGANIIDASVVTETLRDRLDPTVRTSNTRSEFAAVFDIGAYGKLHLHERLSLNFGYNFLWLANVSRADRNIYYNDNGLLNPPAVVVQKSKTDIWLEGISVGGEVNW